MATRSVSLRRRLALGHDGSGGVTDAGGAGARGGSASGGGARGGGGEDGLGTEDGVRDAYAAHGAELYRFALRALGDRGSAEDVVQETFLRAWRSADRYDAGRASRRVWLFAIARNVVIDHTRRRSAGPWPSAMIDLADSQSARDTATATDETDRVLESWLVEEALTKLSENHRDVLVETYLRDRPYEEVAADRGVPMGTLRSRTFYALKALRLVLDEMGVLDESGVSA